MGKENRRELLGEWFRMGAPFLGTAPVALDATLMGEDRLTALRLPRCMFRVRPDGVAQRRALGYNRVLMDPAGGLGRMLPLQLVRTRIGGRWWEWLTVRERELKELTTQEWKSREGQQRVRTKQVRLMPYTVPVEVGQVQKVELPCGCVWHVPELEAVE